jgi:hypothetical protein
MRDALAILTIVSVHGVLVAIAFLGEVAPNTPGTAGAWIAAGYAIAVTLWQFGGVAERRARRRAFAASEDAINQAHRRAAERSKELPR